MIGDLIKNHPQAEKHLFIKGAKLMVNDGKTSQVCFVEQGDLQIILAYGDKVLFEISAPVTIGVQQLYTHCYNYYTIFKTDATVWLLDIECFKTVVENNNIWHELMVVICHVMDRIDDYHRTTYLATNSYDLVKHCLEQIWQLPEQERENTSVFTYIMKRHNISRSSITKIIHSLNVGGYIKTKRGILLQVKKIPHGY
ncbi:helix-turn-helix domain-containing protein [Buttiauxella warmboldiae]|nr:helix-turn-helix domain-containing protein [Buttiauxella warmboldiae]